MLPLHCHKELPDMTKSELQIALAAATDTNKRTAGVFLDTLCNLAYKEIKKNGEFGLPGFGKLVKQKYGLRVCETSKYRTPNLRTFPRNSAGAPLDDARTATLHDLSLRF
jgi:nucleoid DNA-binding protein